MIKDGGAASAGTYAGIYLNDVDYNTIVGNNIGNIGTVNLKYGIQQDTLSDYNLYDGNVCGVVVTDGILLAAANNNVVGDNVENPDP